MKKLKVLHIIWSTHTGGIERLVMQLWKLQQQDPSLEVALYAGQPGGTLWKEFEATGTVHQGLFRSGADVGIQKIRATARLFSQYDLLHYHSFHPATALAGIRSGARILYTEHGNFGFGRRLRLTDRINRHFLKIFLRKHCFYITFNSEFSMKTAGELYGLTGERMKVVYNGISDYRADTAPDQDICDFVAGHFTIGFIGRLSAVKRIDRLIEVARLLKTRIAFRMVIIGDGPLKAPLQTTVQETGLTHALLFAGNRTDVRRFYPLFDAFVLSSANEAFGLVVAEALYAGIPVFVFSDAGGPVEMIRQHEPENSCASPAEMAEKIYRLSLTGKIDTAVSRRKETAALFSLQKMETAFKTIYTSR